MKLLDLFCGAGGAGMGYYRAGFEVTGVDIKPQPHYPFTFIQADALEYCAAHGHEYDVIHASPPCQHYSEITPLNRRNNHPDLIADVRRLLDRFNKPYVIENVEGARTHMLNPIMLCGSMFGLQIFRHRYFEVNTGQLFFVPPCNHSFKPVYITGSWRDETGKKHDSPIADKRMASGIDWMVMKELDEAIPPAYTEFIGRQILSWLRKGDSSLAHAV